MPDKEIDYAISDLTMYLKAHEDDIANEINDFGNLKRIFVFYFDRFPKRESDNG